MSKEETHVGIISYDHEAKVESLSHFRVYYKWFIRLVMTDRVLIIDRGPGFKIKQDKIR